MGAFITCSGGDDPAVCFIGTKIPGLEFLIGRRNYEPWALLFDRQKFYDSGGGPVWYVCPHGYWELSWCRRHVKTDHGVASEF